MKFINKKVFILIQDFKMEKTSHPLMLEKSISRKPEISIWLDTYDDIFSDFDSRPYSDRLLSDDFIKEAKKVSFEKPGVLQELKLLMPHAHRNEETEAIIRRNLHLQFKNKYNEMRKEIRLKRFKGLLFICCGMLLMLAGAYLSSIKEKTFGIRLLFVLVEPAGWFTSWTGLEQVFYKSKSEKENLAFYSRLAKAKISFTVY